MGKIFTAFLLWCGSHKLNLISWFYLACAGYFALILLGGYLIAVKSEWISLSVWLGTNSGKLAVMAFLATTYPGMLGRLGLRHPLITLGMMFRRECGIASFFLSLGHALLVYLVPKLVFKLPLFHLLTFELLGALAFILLTALYLTSSKNARQKMGVWWKRLHSLVYVIYWLVLLHLLLRGDISLIGVVVGLSASLEIFSLIFAGVVKRRKKSLQPDGASQ